jgi:hypothetical protein
MSWSSMETIGVCTEALRMKFKLAQRSILLT